MRYLVILLLPLLLLVGCEKDALNRQMQELCKKDGGIRVYETVTLPASRFGEYGELLPVMPIKDAKNLGELLFGDKYAIKNEIETIKNGETHGQLYGQGRLDKNTEKIIRNSDGKILGESIWYSRIGGELTLFGMPSGSNCPYPRENIFNHVFLEGSN